MDTKEALNNLCDAVKDYVLSLDDLLRSRLQEAVKAVKERSEKMASITTASEPSKESDPGTLPRLLLWKKDVCSMLGVKIRTLDRMISSGEFPAPDRQLRGRPAWLPKTIEEWSHNGSDVAKLAK